MNIRRLPLSILPILFLSLAVLITGCSNQLQAAPPPSITPTSSLAENTPSDTPTPTTETATSTPTTPPANRQLPNPAATLTQVPVESVEFGLAAINILRPGQLSLHTSPIRIIANLATPYTLHATITLYGEDGRTILEETRYPLPYDDPVNGNLITEIEFTLPGFVEAGRLEIKVEDKVERILALNSIELILLASSHTARNYAPESNARILLQLPAAGQEIAGDAVLVSGWVRTDSDSPLDIWLQDEEGETIAQGQASVVLNPEQSLGQFVASIPYQVEERTPVRLAIGISDGTIPGYTFIYSTELFLSPPTN